MLELNGFNLAQVKILNGGTLKWSAVNALDKDPVERQPGRLTLKPANPDLLVEWTDVYDDAVSRRDPEVVLLDARPRAMYTGEMTPHSIEGGHIPEAVNVVSPDGTEGQSQKWLSDDALAELYKDFPKDKTVYVYCHDGFRMSLAYRQLKHLGGKDVRLYNDGWSHWGNKLTLPVL